MEALILIVVFLALGLSILIAQEIHERKKSKNTDETAVSTPQNTEDGECCGQHLVCERDSLLNRSTEIEYYDDEELDRFAQRPSDGYTDEEAEEFREVLYTMKPEEAKGWNRSLILRHINVPNQVKDELVMMMGE